jgi:hypothetical protein
MSVAPEIGALNHGDRDPPAKRRRARVCRGRGPETSFSRLAKRRIQLHSSSGSTTRSRVSRLGGSSLALDVAAIAHAHLNTRPGIGQLRGDAVFGRRR